MQGGFSKLFGIPSDTQPSVFCVSLKDSRYGAVKKLWGWCVVREREVEGQIEGAVHRMPFLELIWRFLHLRANL